MLRTISLRRMWEHKLRTFLTIVGIALGVAGFIAVEMITDTLKDSFARMIDQVAGRVQLQVTGGDSGVDEALLKRLTGNPDLAAALPVIQVMTKLTTADHKADRISLLLVAVDTLNDRAARDYKMKDAHGVEISDPLLFLNARNAILLAREFAEKYKIKIDQSIELQTSQGKKTFVVRGLLEPEGPATAFGGNFALMDVYAAQLLFGRDGKFDTIDLMLKPGKQVPQVEADLSKLLGGKYDVVRPSQRTQGVDNMMETFDLGLSVQAMVVLAMGIFIIINTVTTSVLQRRREIGIQRMVGVTRWTIWGQFALEGMLFGIAGAAVGTGAGYFMGHWAVLNFAGKISSMFVLVDLSKVSFKWTMAAKGMSLGVGISLIASIWPAWQATRITPLDVVRLGPSLTKGKGIALRRWLYGLVPSAAVTIYLIFAKAGFDLELSRIARLLARPYSLWFRKWGFELDPSLINRVLDLLPKTHYTLLAKGGFGLDGVRVMMITLLVAAITCTPLVMLALLALVRALARGQSSALLRLSADNIVRDLGRAAMTVAAFMVGLAVMLLIYLFVTSTKHEIQSWIEEALTADLIITNSSQIALREAIPVTDALGDELAKVPGVKSIAAVRLLMTDFNNTRIAVLALDLKHHLNKARFRFVKGDKEAGLKLVAAGEAVFLTQNLALRQHMQDAKTITVNTPTGKHVFPVAGIIMDYTSEQGAVVMDRTLYVDVFHDHLADTFHVYLQPGATHEQVEQVRAAIQQNPYMKESFNLFVLTNREFKGTVMQAIDQLFALAYSLEFLAMVIAFIGIVNNLMATVVDRTREIGVIRSIGATRGQVARIFLSQAALLAISGAVISLGCGFAMAAVQLTRIYEIYTGYALPLYYEWWKIGLTMLAAVFVGVIAGVMPARAAARLTLHEALKYE
jgi:putative ABC transport system permease protein